VTPPHDRKSAPTPFIPTRHRSQDDIEQVLKEERQSKQLRIVLNAVKDLNARLDQEQEKARQRVSQPPPKGPSDPRFWIAIVTGLLGTGGIGMAVENWRTPPPKVPADIELREAELKAIVKKVDALQEETRELQAVVHGMRDFNLAAFEKLRVTFPQYRDDLNRSVIPFTENTRNRVIWYDAHRSYPSLKKQP
jgi:hypothetical protein